MKKRLLFLILLFAAIGRIGWEILWPHEPAYKGKSLTNWIDDSEKTRHATAKERSAALAAMSEEAVPYLAKQLHWKPSRVMVRLYHRFPNFPPFLGYMQGRSDPRGKAAHQLGEFGPLAAKAVPDLIMASTNSDLPSSWYQQMCARAALIKIRQESLKPYTDQLTNTVVTGMTSIENWYQNALLVGEFGTNGAAAVPNLISAIRPGVHPVIQAHAIMALGEIHSRPELSVPAIIPFLSSPDVALRQKAVIALGQFGAVAQPAWKDLVLCLDDPDPYIRTYAAGWSLKQINPDAAAKAIKEHSER